MFGLFKKRQQPQPGDEAHPQHRNFARIFISGTLRAQRNRFLTLLIDARASQALQEAWHSFGAKVLPAESLRPPTGLGVSAFRHEKHLCILIIFPKPQAAGESYFGFIVAGPSDDWSAERAPVPARYFLLERSTSDTPTIFEWRSTSAEDEWVFESLGPGPAPQHPPDFTEIILSRFYGLKPDGTIDVAADDPEMVAAIAAARATLPQYWQEFEHRERGETDFSLKVKISDTHGTEHFWVVDVSREDGAVYGTIDNEPQLVTSVKPGSRVLVKPEDITDWGYVRDGKMHGKHTLRVLMKHMPPKEAEIYRKILAEP